MAIAFTREGHDASAVCADLAFSYFLVTGSLTPTVVGTNRAPLSSLLTSAPNLNGAGSPYRAPAAELAAEARDQSHAAPPALEEKREGTCTGEQDIRGNGRQGESSDEGAYGNGRSELPARACDAWAANSPCENGASCSLSDLVWSPAAPKKEGDDWVDDVGSGSDIESKSLFSVPTTTLPEAHPPSFASDTQEAVASMAQSSASGVTGRSRCLLTPGQSLDFYLRRRSNTSFGDKFREKFGPESDPGEPTDHEIVPISAGDLTNGMAGTAWHLDAREASCIGRVSRCLLRELEREEEKHEVEMKVAFLHKTEVGRVRHWSEATKTNGSSRAESEYKLMAAAKWEYWDQAFLVRHGRSLRT